MPRRLAGRLLHLPVFLLCVAAGLLGPAGAGAVSSKGCDERVNDTAKKLIPPDAGPAWCSATPESAASKLG